jgi:hypothetical protein
LYVTSQDVIDIASLATYPSHCQIQFTQHPKYNFILNVSINGVVKGSVSIQEDMHISVASQDNQEFYQISDRYGFFILRISMQQEFIAIEKKDSFSCK